MNINDIYLYIKTGKLKSSSLKIDRIEQYPHRKFVTMHSYSEKLIQLVLGTDSRLPKIKDYSHNLKYILNFAKQVYPCLPYYFTMNNEKFRIIKEKHRYLLVSTVRNYSFCPYKDCEFKTITFININNSIKEIINYFRPRKIRRTDKLLGEVFRYNKLLIANKFDPEEFSWIIEKNDIINMFYFDELTKSKIEENEAIGSVFKRKDKYYVLDTNRQLKDYSGKRARFELGYSRSE